MSTSLTGAHTTSTSRIGGSTSSKLYYPSPFFDIASQFMPSSVRDLFKQCEYYYKMHWVIHQCISKMAKYPITDLVVEDEDSRLAKKWEELFNDHLDYKSYLVSVLIDKNTYGNVYAGPLFPFVKTLICPKCKEEYRADESMKHWTFSNYKFRLTCPKCKSRGNAIVEDRRPPNIEKLKLWRWNPCDVLVAGSEFNDLFYFYEVPTNLRNTWVLGQKHKVLGTPQEFIMGVKEQKFIIINPDNMMHMKRAAVSGMDSSLGVPLMFPLFKDAFLFQIFKKSCEMLLLENAVPWRALFPQPATGASDPTVLFDLKRWKRQMEDTVVRWRLDPNYVGILPYPVSQAKIGGEAKLHLMGEEMRKQAEMLVAGMGVPSEFIFGGLQYSGTNVSLKMLENDFINDRHDLKRLTKFLMKRIGAYIGWRPARDVSFRNFRMADDLQRKMFYMQLNAANKLSDTTLLDECDLDSEKEDKLMQQEAKRRRKSVEEQQLATAEIQAEIQATLQKHGLKTQFDLQKYQQRLQSEEGMDTGAGAGANTNIPTFNLEQQVTQLAGQAAGMDEQQRQQYLQQLSGQHPQLGSMVGQLVQRMQAGGQGGSMMKPMPEQRPPRRMSEQ